MGQARGRVLSKPGAANCYRQLTATLAALRRNQTARNRHQAARARHDMMGWTPLDGIDVPK